VCICAVTSARITTPVPDESFTSFDEAVLADENVETLDIDDGDTDHTNTVVTWNTNL
jgi:hypothetical protein